MCADCWWENYDLIKEQKTFVKDFVKKAAGGEKFQKVKTCFECGENTFVYCDTCGRGLCAKHAVPWRENLRTYYCGPCYRKEKRLRCILAIFMFPILFAIRFFLSSL